MPDVLEVKCLGAYRIYLRFDDGVAGELDLRDALSFRGVFAPLVDEAEFAKVRVEPELGTIVWECGADLCPDVLYSKVTGKAVDELPADGSPG